MSSDSKGISCEGCLFARQEGKAEQTGCDAGRESLFIETSESVAWKTLNRFCNMYRNEEWSEQLPEDVNPLKAAKLEIMSKFGIVVYDNPNDSLALMEKTLDSILAATKKYTKSKIGVLMSFNAGDRQISETLHLSNFYSKEGLWCRGCDQVEGIEIKEKETNLFQQLVFAHWFIAMEAGQTVSPNLFVEIERVNNELNEKVVCYEDGEVVVVLKAAVSSYYPKPECGDYQKTVQYLINESKQRGLYKRL